MVFNRNEVSAHIAAWQKRNKLTQEHFAKRIGISSVTLRNKLSGRTTFTSDEICEMAILFNVKPDIFFTNEVPNNAIG
ncbi:MAG: XRE family transcriptional regulator [Candidatus Moranbacteria bacterium]|nr:XRE family transcriptional regulator [Candidatus Moranbacteria bacterium]